MSRIEVMIGDVRFEAQLNDDVAPLTCARFRALLPWTRPLVPARWIGEGCWVPLRGLDLRANRENATGTPRAGQFIFYPGGDSEAAILFAYGPVSFCNHGSELAGNPFLTIVGGPERLAGLGRELAASGPTIISFGRR